MLIDQRSHNWLGDNGEDIALIIYSEACKSGRTRYRNDPDCLSAHFKTNTGLSVEDFMQIDLANSAAPAR